MKEFKNVRGSMETVPIIEVGIDTVYVRSNVVSINEEGFTGWQYDEIQYGKDEYIELMSKKNGQLEEKSKSQDMVIEDLMFNVIPFLGGM